mgnify:CR=1 FL=1
MAAYESIVNVEEFIADHYFTTDETKGNSYGKRVAAVVKQWRDDAKAAEADGFSLSHPFVEVTANRNNIQKLLVSGDTKASNAMLREVLGYGAGALGEVTVDSASGDSIVFFRTPPLRRSSPGRTGS